MSTHIYFLQGGMVGPDGFFDGWGIATLGRRLDPYGILHMKFWNQVDSGEVANEIKSLPADADLIFIGFSGGGSRASWLARQLYPRQVKLIVGYDPSPWWQMKRLQDNVQRAITYYNPHPLMGALGSGKYSGPKTVRIETLSINGGWGEQHLAVQFDETLHQLTIAAVQQATKQA
jgi:hypothetical protein